MVVAAVVLVIVVAVAATRGGTKIDPTKLAKVEKGDLAKSVVATGKVTPITKVEIKSKASGIVKKLYVDTGDKVKQGQVLAELDKIEIEAQVNSGAGPAAVVGGQPEERGSRREARRSGCPGRRHSHFASAPTSAPRRCRRTAWFRSPLWTTRSEATSWRSTSATWRARSYTVNKAKVAQAQAAG